MGKKDKNKIKGSAKVAANPEADTQYTDKERMATHNKTRQQL